MIIKAPTTRMGGRSHYLHSFNHIIIITVIIIIIMTVIAWSSDQHSYDQDGGVVPLPLTPSSSPSLTWPLTWSSDGSFKTLTTNMRGQCCKPFLTFHQILIIITVIIISVIMIKTLVTLALAFHKVITMIIMIILIWSKLWSPWHWPSPPPSTCFPPLAHSPEHHFVILVVIIAVIISDIDLP